MAPEGREGTDAEACGAESREGPYVAHSEEEVKQEGMCCNS